jgi:hypothetical protein
MRGRGKNTNTSKRENFSKSFLPSKHVRDDNPQVTTASSQFHDKVGNSLNPTGRDTEPAIHPPPWKEGGEQTKQAQRHCTHFLSHDWTRNRLLLRRPLLAPEYRTTIKSVRPVLIKLAFRVWTACATNDIFMTKPHM